MDYYDQINANVLSATFRQNAQINLKINTSRENFVRPEAFGAKANNPNFDNTNALMQLLPQVKIFIVLLIKHIM